MVKKHPVLCLLGWILFCCVAYVMLKHSGTDLAGVLFFFYMYDHGKELILKEIEKEEQRGPQ